MAKDLSKMAKEITKAAKKSAPAVSVADEMHEDVVEAKSSSAKRPSLRPELRDDPLARARARAAQIRENLGDSGLDEGEDRFRVAINEIPEGWNYEWKRKLLINQPDHAYEVELARKGWEPVPASRHPHMMPAGKNHDTIERDGMILMERPKELTDEARDVELRRARAQVKQKEGQIDPENRGGILSRSDSRVRPDIRKGYEPLPIPND